MRTVTVHLPPPPPPFSPSRFSSKSSCRASSMSRSSCSRNRRLRSSSSFSSLTAMIRSCSSLLGPFAFGCCFGAACVCAGGSVAGVCATGVGVGCDTGILVFGCGCGWDGVCARPNDPSGRGRGDWYRFSRYGSGRLSPAEDTLGPGVGYAPYGG